MKTDRCIQGDCKDFDFHLPPEGHFERFAARLESHKARRNNRKRWMTVVTVMIAASFALLLYVIPPTDVAPESSESLSEVTNYYNLQMDEEIGRIAEQLTQVDEAARNELMSDLQAMQRATRKYQESLSKQSDENYISAVVLHYNAQMASLLYIHTLLPDLPKRAGTNS